jgi:acyl-CoA synthetase (AMP-forming)/AMP-acid ligase II
MRGDKEEDELNIPELAVQPTMPAVVYRGARTFGERDWVVTPDKRLSFAQAERASRRIAKQLLAAGVGKGTRVGVQLENSVEWALTWLAITRIGAVMATLSTAYKPAELAKITLHADLHMLITQDRLFDQDHLAFVEKAFPSLKQAEG